MVRAWLKLALEEYPTWVSKELEKLLRPAVSKGRKLIDEAGRTLDESRRFFDDLYRKADKDMATKRDPVSYRAARVIGHSAREASESIARLQLPSDVTLDSMKSVRDSLSIVSRSLRDSRNRTAGELVGLYILDMRSFGGVIDRMSRAAGKLSEFLEGEGSSLQKARTLNGIVTTIQDIRKEIVEREEETNNLSHDQQLIANEIRKLESELERLSSEGPLHEVLKIERELRKESREFRTETLAHLQRPLRKLRDLSQRGEIPLGQDEREALNNYVTSPYRSFLSKETGRYVGSLLQSLQSALRSGKMEFKPRKAARVMAQLDQLVGTERLSERQRRGRELLSKRWKLLQDSTCKSHYQARKNMMKTLEEARKHHEDVIHRIRSIEEKPAALNKRLAELLTMAEARTGEYVGRQVQIERLQLTVQAT